ncbi:hypothetical protein CJU90_5533 [Yarrowia sp. C11]|nr:hypothetical protein CJU90_5533 [Yarrowia sp. C11]
MSRAGGYINGVVSDNKTPSPSQPPVQVPKRKPVHRKPVGATDSNTTTPTTSPKPPHTASPLLGPPIVPYGAASASGVPAAASGPTPAAVKKQYRYSSMLDPEPASPKAPSAERRPVSESRKVTPLQTTSAGGLSGAINFSKPVSPASQHAQPGVGFGRAQTAHSSNAQPPSLPPKVPIGSTHNPYSGTQDSNQGSYGHQATAPIYQPSHQLPRAASPDSDDYQHSPPRRTLRVVNDFSSSSDEDEPAPAAAPQVPTVVKTPAGPREYPLSNRMSHLEINDGNHLDPFAPAAPLRIHKKTPSSTSNPSFDFATRDSFYGTPSGSTDDIEEYVTNESYVNSQRGGVDPNNRPMSSLYVGNQSYDSGSSHSTRPMSGEDLLAGHHLHPQYTHESAIDPFNPSYDPHHPGYEPRTSYEHPEPPSPDTPAISEGMGFDGAAFGGGAVIGGSVAPVLLDPSVNIPDPSEYGAFDVGAPLVPSITNLSTGTGASMPGIRGAPSIISTTSQVSQKGINNSDYPSLGVESQYVRALRKRTASAWCEVPSKVWGLPLGISDKAGKKFNKNMDMRYAAGLKRTMDIRHSHLKPRLLASEVDDDDGKRTSSHTDMPSSMHAPSIHSMSRYDNRSIISHDDDVDGRSSVSLVSAPQESTPPPAMPTSRGRAASDSSQESVQEVRRIHLFVANPDSD